jgi:hypothetical protein
VTYDERELKQLYQAMREEEARRAPSFAQSIRALPRHAQLGYLRAVAITAALAIVALVMGVNAIRSAQASKTRSSGAPSSSAPPISAAVTPAPAVTATAPSTAAPQVARRKPHAAPSISEWKSPTASLLDVPGDDLYTTVPSLQYKSASLSD